MISAVFRRGGDVSFVAEELKAVFDPQGGRWIGGKYVPSLLAAIGEVIERHMVRIGFMAGPAQERMVAERIAGASFEEVATATGADLDQSLGEDRRSHPVGKFCPRCSSRSYVMEEGCWICRSCGFSRCE
jgi:ribonucleoside-diphosphate reductase alpha chain